MTHENRIRDWLLKHDMSWTVIKLASIHRRDPAAAAVAICERHNIDISGLETKDAVLAHIASELEKL